MEQDPRSRGLNLCSFLIKPVQRICKYPLFLRVRTREVTKHQELMKNTPAEHSDFEQLRKSIAKIDEVVEVLNEGKRQFEAMQRILEIQESVEGLTNLLQPARKLIQQGILMVSTRSEYFQTEHALYLFNGKTLTGTLFTISDMLLVVKRKEKAKPQSKISYQVRVQVRDCSC